MIVTMTGMYDVVEMLRAGEPLTPRERKVHEVAACDVLRDLHDEFGRLVADTYGWPWPMETEEVLARLVALHDERVEEERRGVVQWLRSDYQLPRFGDRVEAGDAATATSDADPAAPEGLPAWPDDAIADRPDTVEAIARRLQGARRAEVEKHVALKVLGVLAGDGEGKWVVQRMDSSVHTQ